MMFLLGDLWYVGGCVCLFYRIWRYLGMLSKVLSRLEKQLAVAVFCGAVAVAPYGYSAEIIHEVKRGDYLSNIAQKYDVSVESIVEANNLKSVNNIQLGQKLVIKTADPEPESAPAPAPAPEPAPTPEAAPAPAEKEAAKPAAKPAGGGMPSILGNGSFDHWTEEGKLKFWTVNPGTVEKTDDKTHGASAIKVTAKVPHKERGVVRTYIKLPEGAGGKELHFAMDVKAPVQSVKIQLGGKEAGTLKDMWCKTKAEAYTTSKFSVKLPADVDEQLWMAVVVKQTAQLDKAYAYLK